MLIKLALTGTSQSHQESAANKLDTSPGLLINHGLGSGKGYTALLAGERTKGHKLVVVPAALQENFAKEIRKFKANEKDYSIISLEKFRKNPETYISQYNPSLVIADEFHRTRNSDSISHESFDRVRSSFPKMLGLTGSPISNHPSELVPLINTVAGKKVFKNEDEFKHNFISEEQVRPGLLSRLMGTKSGTREVPKNLDRFKQKISPYVHSFHGDEAYMKEIPTVNRDVEYVKMDNEQQKYYNFAFDQMPSWARSKIQQNLPPSKRESHSLNTFLAAARQISNTPESFGASTTSPKVKAMVHDIRSGLKKNPKFKSVTYSNFVDSGLKPIARELDSHGIKYGLFTGEQDDKTRQQIIRDYNSGSLKHLLVSPAGVEGLDLKETTLHQIMDPHFNPERTKQAIGRSARFRSHIGLPENERNVHVREYLAEPQMRLTTRLKRFIGLAPKNVHEMGTDQYIYNRSHEKEFLNSSFLNAMGELK